MFYLQSYLSHFSQFCIPKTGSFEAVVKLKAQGYKLGLVSNSKTPFQENNFNALDVHKHFDSVVISEAVNCRKPELKIFLLACEQLGVLPNEAVFVGDNPVADIVGAKNAGMFTVFIPSEQHETCDEADAACQGFQALPKIISNFP